MSGPLGRQRFPDEDVVEAAVRLHGLQIGPARVARGLVSGAIRVWQIPAQDAYGVELHLPGMNGLQLMVGADAVYGLVVQRQMVNMQQQAAYQAAYMAAIQRMMPPGLSLMGGPGANVEAEPPSKLWENPETITTEILGFRFWDLAWEVENEGQAHPLLRSPYQKTAWDGPTLSGPAPEANTPHGIYAIGCESWQREAWEMYLGRGRYQTHQRPAAPVWGVVALSGMVAEGHYGYRAERATIRELNINPMQLVDSVGTDTLGRMLERRYGCDSPGVGKPTWEFCTEYMAKARTQPKGETDGEAA